MWQERTVSDMVLEVLTRQAKALIYQTGQPFEEALVAILRTDSGRQLTELADGPHSHEQAHDWQANLVRRGIEESQYAWLDDYKEWLEDDEARVEHHAFLKHALDRVAIPLVGAW